MRKILLQRVVPVLLLMALLGANGGCTQKSRVRWRLDAGNRAFNAEKYDNAEVEFRNVLNLDRLNPIAIGQLGRIFAKEGRVNEARVYLAKATELQPNTLPFQLALGQVYVSFRDSTNAAKIAVRILSSQPTNEEALLLLIDSFVPVQDMRHLVETIPNLAQNPAYHVAVGMVALRQQQFAEGESQFRQALAVNPKSSAAYLALAELYLTQKDLKAAIDSLKAAAEASPIRSPNRLRYANYLIQNSRVEEARKILQEMKEKAPDYIPTQVALMNLAMTEKRYDDVASFANEILARDSQNYDALLGEGNVYLARGDAAKAVAHFERMDSLYKRSPQLRYQLAMAYLMSQDKVKAVANLNESLKLDPTYGQAVMLLAQLDVHGGDAAAAVGILTRLIQKSPNIAQAHLLLADAYMAEQKPDSAIAVYRALGERVPKNPQIPLLIGVVLNQQGKRTAARVEFEKAFALAPTYMLAVEQIINLDITEHKYKDATAITQTQINQNPKAAEPWELQAKVDLAQTNLSNAETDLLKAINLNPDLPNPYLLLAQVYVMTDKYKDALQKLNTLVGRTNDAPAFLQIGAIHEQLKEYEPARDAYEKVLTINPRSTPALNNLAYIYTVHLNNLDRAYDLAQKARALRPYDPHVSDTLGYILYKKGDYARALTLLEDSAEKAPGDAEIQYHLGMAHYMLDDEALARLALQRATATQQDYPDKKEARNRLALLESNPTNTGLGALAALEKELGEYPNDPVILNRIAAAQEAGGQADKAAATYEKILKMNPEAVQTIAKLARLYAVQLDQPEKAMDLAKTAHKLAPDNAEVSGVLGRLVFQTGDHAWALSLLENAADRLPDRPELQHDLAWAYYSQGRMDEAERAMAKAAQSPVKFTESGDAKQFLDLTAAFTSAAPNSAAVAQAQKILQSNPKYVPALLVSAESEDRAGNYKAARDAYGKVLEIYPMFVPAARLFAILDARHFTDDSQGYAWAEKAHTAYPEDLPTTKSLGILGYAQGRYRRSAEVLQESSSKSPNDGEVFYYLGLDYVQLKQLKDAKQALDHSLKLKISDPLAAHARQALSGLK